MTLSHNEKSFAPNQAKQLKLTSTHPPHVSVSAEVLLKDRRAKGGFSFGVCLWHV